MNRRPTWARRKKPEEPAAVEAAAEKPLRALLGPFREWPAAGKRRKA